VAEAVSARLAKTTVGNPRNESVRMGALVSRAQKAAVLEGLALLKTQAEVLHDGARPRWWTPTPNVSCCVGPTLLGARDADAAAAGARHEVFGPVATLRALPRPAHALALVRRGQGSLVASLYGSDAGTLACTALDLAASHGRVHVVSPEVAATHTGHGNVMPQSLHGGPGRAGGGEELGGAAGAELLPPPCRHAGRQRGAGALGCLGWRRQASTRSQRKVVAAGDIRPVAALTTGPCPSSRRPSASTSRSTCWR
jgi:3,4-dehydroadipyl-CoA semialdehyde dehydrogenase